MPVLALLLAAAVAAPSSADELPLPPLDPETLALTAPPSVTVPVTPVAPPTPSVATPPPPTVVPAPVSVTPPVVAAPPRQLFTEVPFLVDGYGSSGLRLGAFNGSAALLGEAAAAVRLGDFDLGLALTTGGSGGVWTTFAGPRVAWEFARPGPVDLSVGMSVGVGAAGNGTAMTALAAWTPEFSAKLRLLPFVRAYATASWRLANVWTWVGTRRRCVRRPGPVGGSRIRSLRHLSRGRNVASAGNVPEAGDDAKTPGIAGFSNTTRPGPDRRCPGRGRMES